MRNLERNKCQIWFANRLTDEYVLDNNGLKTGEKRQTYGDPVSAMMHIGIAQGNATLNAYGLTTDYTHTAITEDKNCQMDEESIVWCGIPTSEPHNFIVVHKGESLNHLVFYLKEVDVS